MYPHSNWWDVKTCSIIYPLIV